MYSGQHLVCNTAVSRPLPADMTIVTFLSEVLCVYCVFTQKNTYNIFEYAVYYAIIPRKSIITKHLQSRKKVI